MFLTATLQEKHQTWPKPKKIVLLGNPSKSSMNHLYWSTATAFDGNGIVIRWKSFMDHTCNKHDDCFHNPLDTREERRKKLNSQLFTYVFTTIYHY